MTNAIELCMPAEPHSATEARRALDPLEERVDAPVLEDLRLLVTELVTNSVRHADTGREAKVGLRVALAGPVVRVEVTDEGSGFTPRRRADDAESKLHAGGWGLYMVERLATRWGVVKNHRVRVWFELETSYAATA